MREIKFRAWDGRKYVIYQIVEKDGTLYDADFGKQMEVQQFTGFKDKSRKEIYEGDIVRVESVNGIGRIGEVCWVGYSWKLKVVARSKGKELWRNEVMGITNTRKVIGNIYENSELLK
jgi:uncharacterized phage protein (TIGR01671 family)